MTLTLKDRPLQADDELAFVSDRQALSLDLLSSEPEPLDGVDAAGLDSSDGELAGGVPEATPLRSPDSEPVHTERSRDVIDSYSASDRTPR